MKPIQEIVCWIYLINSRYWQFKKSWVHTWFILFVCEFMEFGTQCTYFVITVMFVWIKQNHLSLRHVMGFSRYIIIVLYHFMRIPAAKPTVCFTTIISIFHFVEYSTKWIDNRYLCMPWSKYKQKCKTETCPEIELTYSDSL